MAVAGRLHRRDAVNKLKHTDGYFGSASTTAKFSVFGAIFIFAILFFSLSYWHIIRRRKKGLEPLKYHAWMVRRQRPPMFGPQPARPTYSESLARPTRPTEDYKLTDLRPPPPVYNADIPPAYQKDTVVTSEDAGSAPNNVPSQPTTSNPAVINPPEVVYK